MRFFLFIVHNYFLCEKSLRFLDAVGTFAKCVCNVLAVDNGTQRRQCYDAGKLVTL